MKFNGRPNKILGMEFYIVAEFESSKNEQNYFKFFTHFYPFSYLYITCSIGKRCVPFSQKLLRTSRNVNVRFQLLMEILIRLLYGVKVLRHCINYMPEFRVQSVAESSELTKRGRVQSLSMGDRSWPFDLLRHEFVSSRSPDVLHVWQRSLQQQSPGWQAHVQCVERSQPRC